MSLGLVMAFAPLDLEGGDLLGPELIDDTCLHRSALDHGITDVGRVSIPVKEHF